MARETLTFMFTDIEGSTALWQSAEERMSGAIAKHDDLLKAAIESEGGWLVKHTGDGMLAAFNQAKSALKAAVAAQSAFQLEIVSVFKVRIALHTGDVEARSGDYFGTPVNKCARILSAIHGGQVVLSSATYELVADQLPNGVALQSLGAVRLRDLSRPESLVRVDCAGYPTIAKAPKGVESFRNNLPSSLDQFFGRSSELSQCLAALPTSRLVTLWGPGGSGKTRLSLQLGGDLLDQYPNGVWFVDLSSARTDSDVAQFIASALGIEIQDALPERISGRIGDLACLFILDNCEQIVKGARDISRQILHDCRNTAIIATSREQLRLPGEVVVKVGQLAGALLPGVLSDSVQLFLDRAKRSGNDYENDPAALQAISEICQTLDDLPLAIELASSRTDMLSPKQILDKVVKGISLLSDDTRHVERHASLSAAISWSYGLLSNADKQVLHDCVVFVAPFDLSAAESVLQREGTEVLDSLDRLVRGSFLSAFSSGTVMRYRLLDSMRAFLTSTTRPYEAWANATSSTFLASSIRRADLQRATS